MRINCREATALKTARIVFLRMLQAFLDVHRLSETVSQIFFQV